MKDLMVDLETLGKKADSVILQIGAIYFDRHTGKLGRRFKLNIDLDDSLDNGFTVDADTIFWWINQSEEARKSITDNITIDVIDAIDEFNDFVDNDAILWCHASFDYPMIKHHLSTFGIKSNINFRNVRDLRTIVNLAKVDYKNMERTELKHDTIGDCQFQIRYVVECFERMKNG